MPEDKDALEARESEFYFSTTPVPVGADAAAIAALTWVKLGIAHDVGRTNSFAQIEKLSRRNKDKAWRRGRRDRQFALTIDNAPGDQTFDQFAALVESGAEFAFADMPGDITTEGLKGVVVNVKAYGLDGTAGTGDEEQTLSCPLLPTGTYCEEFTVPPAV